MKWPYLRLLLAWIALLALWGTEFGCSYLKFDRSLRPVLIVPAIMMAAVLAFAFMRVRAGPAVVRGFAIAGLFWLTILLGLGTADPLTRAVYPAPADLGQQGTGAD
jgi:cytochrome c oxidase subunit 4